MQGGLQVGMALVTAAATLPATWQISGVSAWFLRPGEGEEIVATARVEHRGRNTAVVRTVLAGRNEQRFLEAVSTHLRRG
jgi:acyl-coenzyme A thioesterase PaaI-like protein